MFLRNGKSGKAYHMNSTDLNKFMKRSKVHQLSVNSSKSVAAVFGNESDTLENRLNIKLHNTPLKLKKKPIHCPGNRVIFYS